MIKSQKDFFAGLMFVIVGLAFAIGAYSYNMGNGARMGPGYFPRLLGFLLALLGSVIVANAMRIPTKDGEKIGTISWQPLLYIIGANVLFGICIGGLPSIGLPALGLIVGIYVLTIVSSKASNEFEWKGVLILATVLSLMSYLAFIVLLKLQFPVWPAFLTK